VNGNGNGNARMIGLLERVLFWTIGVLVTISLKVQSDQHTELSNLATSLAAEHATNVALKEKVDELSRDMKSYHRGTQ